MYDYLVSTTNIDPPVDANSNKLCESTFLNPKGVNVPHPTAINPL